MTPELNGNPWDVLEGPSTRTPRALETRETSKRQTEWKRGTSLPEFESRDGFAFKWVRSSVNGIKDDKTYQARLYEGYEPVMASDFPELAHEVRFSASGLVERGGLILCKIPQEVVDDRQRQLANITQNKLDAAEESFMRDPDEKAQRLFKKRSREVFGR